MDEETKFQQAKDLIFNAKYLVVFTGAGMSIESGIPTFTGINGLWTKYDPKFIELYFFNSYALESWKEIKKIFYDFMLDSTQPNFGHYSIAKLEQQKIVKYVITQNIDGLHQKAGCKNVIEFHGTVKTLTCQHCNFNIEYKSQLLASLPPKCPNCGNVLKPDFIFYGEQIKPDVYELAINQILKADVILIIGTSGQVMPANYLPILAKNKKNTKIIEVNPSASSFTNTITDLYFPMKVTTFFKNILSFGNN